jgi:hypothetical protein
MGSGIHSLLTILYMGMIIPRHIFNAIKQHCNFKFKNPHPSPFPGVKLPFSFFRQSRNHLGSFSSD